MFLGIIKKIYRGLWYGKIPILILCFSLFSVWNYYSKHQIYTQENSIEFSSIDTAKEVPKNSAELYVGSYLGSSPNQEALTLSFEDQNVCGKDRLYLEPDIDDIGEIFRNRRKNFPEAKIPIECILYSMRSFMYSPQRTSVAYSYCNEEVGSPVRGKKTACLTQEYVYPVYNAYVDVMDCLEIPQTDLIPKLLNESGFHTNALGHGMDAGVGQLTGDAIKSVLQKGRFEDNVKTYLDYHLEEMRRSRKPSCARVLSNKNLISAVSPNQDQRCNMIALPGNPLRNILYTGIFYRYILLNQAGILYSNGQNYIQDGNQWIPWNENASVEYGGYLKSHQIGKKLSKAGLKDANMNAIKQMMITLGYNAGMQTAVIFLDNYLKARIAAKLPVKSSDFDFLQEEFAIFKAVKNPKAEAARQKKLAQIMNEPFRGTFPIYLRLVQKSGTKGYLSNVAAKHKQLNHALGENKCTSPKYLQF